MLPTSTLTTMQGCMKEGTAHMHLHIFMRGSLEVGAVISAQPAAGAFKPQTCPTLPSQHHHLCYCGAVPAHQQKTGSA